MRILALDSSSLVASVALADGDQLLGEYTINYKKTHSQTLLPMLQELTTMLELDLSTVDAIAVAGGPGSFTGLRIGSATAKGLGLALDKPLIHIPTLEGMAYNLYGCQELICPMMDARRNQTYTGLYRFEGETMQTVKPQCAVGVEEIIEEINQRQDPVIFLGDGVPVFRAQLEEQLKVPFRFAPAHMNRQRAASLAVLGQQYFSEGRLEAAADHAPDYLRLSQAERERNQKLSEEKQPCV